MSERYGPDDATLKKQFDDNLFDLYSAMRTNVFFPVYSNGLKPIAAFLGASWSGPVTTGLDSIVWRHRWEQTRQEQQKLDLIRYNQEDCFSLKVLFDFLRSLSGPGNNSTVPMKSTDNLTDKTNTFGRSTFAIPEMKRFIKCAYFNYQHEKVFFRTNKNVRKSVRRKKKMSNAKLRINQTVECGPPKRCSKCGGSDIRIYRSGRQTKKVRDLKFTNSGVKRWVVKYVTSRYQCWECRNTCYSPEYPTKQSKVGSGLNNWVVWQHVAMKQSCCDAIAVVNDLFGYGFSHKVVQNATRRVAFDSKETIDGIRRKLLEGNFICVDETKIKLKDETGYVWIFSNVEEVLYCVSNTRDGAILNEVLSDYNGTLVSDFYGAYDSPECSQQKCLVHLIRDINEDLLKAPFDEELKGIAQPFCDLMKAIIDTIDQFGLKKLHLNKFVKKAEKFTERVIGDQYKSKVAQRYQKRIKKYGDRLFTFLGHDGVPWNNNIAENAVKLIASRRSMFGASFTKKGMEDYVLFLGILQTLRRKGCSFLKFLISEETDLFKFVGEK